MSAFPWGIAQPESVDFFGETVLVVPGRNDDETMVVITPICDHLGIDPKTQRERIQFDPVFAERWGLIPLPSSGGRQETFCLSLSMVTIWLASIGTLRVRDDVQPKLVRYKLECAKVLHNHFFGPDATRHAIIDEVLGTPRNPLDSVIAPDRDERPVRLPSLRRGSLRASPSKSAT